MKKNGFKIMTIAAIILTIITGPLVSYAYTISTDDLGRQINGGITPNPSYISMWSGFGDLTKTQFGNDCFTWNSSIGKNIVARGSDTNANSFTDGAYVWNNQNEVSKVGSKNGYVAVTQEKTGIGWDGRNYIWEINMNVNANQPFTNDPTPGAYHIQSILLHELGHVIGLADLYTLILDNNKIMYYSSVYDNVKTLTSDDINGAKSLYNY